MRTPVLVIFAALAVLVASYVAWQQYSSRGGAVVDPAGASAAERGELAAWARAVREAADDAAAATAVRERLHPAVPEDRRADLAKAVAFRLRWVDAAAPADVTAMRDGVVRAVWLHRRPTGFTQLILLFRRGDGDRLYLLGVMP